MIGQIRASWINALVITVTMIIWFWVAAAVFFVIALAVSDANS